MPKCPYCNKEMEELFDGEWECPKCGKTFVDVGFGRDHIRPQSELDTDTDYDDEEEEDW